MNKSIKKIVFLLLMAIVETSLFNANAHAHNNSFLNLRVASSHINTKYATRTSVFHSENKIKHALDDDTITSRIKSDLSRNTQTRDLKIHVKTISGVVTLSGIAKNARQRQIVNEIALSREGVLRTVNKIQIKNYNHSSIDKVRFPKSLRS